MDQNISKYNELLRKAKSMYYISLTICNPLFSEEERDNYQRKAEHLVNQCNEKNEQFVEKIAELEKAKAEYNTAIEKCTLLEDEV